MGLVSSTIIYSMGVFDRTPKKSAIHFRNPTIRKFQEDSIFDFKGEKNRKDSVQNLTKGWDFEKKCLKAFMACNQTLNP